MGRPRGYRWLKPVVKAIVGPLVLIAVARHAWSTWNALRERGALPHLDLAWGLASVALYLAGLSLFGLYFVLVMRDSVTPVGPFVGVRAYLISHLGKYVPGKALVVVMRVGLVTPFGARASTAAFATFYETLVMMSAGGLIVPLVLPLSAVAYAPSWTGLSGVNVPLGLIGLAMGLGFLVLVSPPVFPRLATLARQPFPDVRPDALPRISWRLLASGLAIASLGWIALGLSQVAVIQALGMATMPLSSWPIVVGSVALATVAGFAVPIAPGGLGVREWVLWTCLGSVLDRDLAVVSSLALRMAWIVGEIGAAAILLALRPSAGPGGIDAGAVTP